MQRVTKNNHFLNIKKLFNTMKDLVESPLKVSSIAGASSKKYFTADEAMSILEPQIRAMFR